MDRRVYGVDGRMGGGIVDGRPPIHTTSKPNSLTILPLLAGLVPACSCLPAGPLRSWSSAPFPDPPLPQTPRSLKLPSATVAAPRARSSIRRCSRRPASPPARSRQEAAPYTPAPVPRRPQVWALPLAAARCTRRTAGPRRSQRPRRRVPTRRGCTAAVRAATACQSGRIPGRTSAAHQSRLVLPPRPRPRAQRARARRPQRGAHTATPLPQTERRRRLARTRPPPAARPRTAGIRCTPRGTAAGLRAPTTGA
eukprot:366456-Chlamydomonas_euryale.AAC.9